MFATSAYLIGRNDDGIGALDRAYHVYLDAGEPVSAARCAIWLGFGLIDAEEISRWRPFGRMSFVAPASTWESRTLNCSVTTTQAWRGGIPSTVRALSWETSRRTVLLCVWHRGLHPYP